MRFKMKKNKQKSNLNVWFLFFALFLIITFFIWYFLIYVSGNEKLLTQKSFRVLSQMGENFKERENSFRKLTAPIMKDVLSYRLESLSIFEKTNKKVKSYYSNMEIDEDSLDKEYFYFSNDYKFISCPLVKEKNDKSNLFFRINKKEFFEPIERKDVFEKIVIIKKKQRNGQNAPTYKFIYSSFPGAINVQNIDSLIVTNKGLSSGIVKDIELLGIEYVLYIKQIQLLNNETYYLGGVINKENYVRQIRAINAYAALLLLIIFFIFLFSIPLIKLRMISENLQLKISDLSYSVLSVIFGAVFTLLVILSFFSHYERTGNVNQSLEKLSNSIRDTLISEIKQIDSTLNTFIKFADSLRKSQSASSQNLYYEFKLDTIHPKEKEISSRFKFQPYTYSKNDKDDKGENTSLQCNFIFSDLAYKYYKLIFDLDSTGQQIVQTSSRNKALTWDKYSFRRYFKESGEWELDSLKIMLDFIVSNTSGEKLGVVSKRCEKFIYVITSRLYSVINTILPQGYGFCVIDKKGDVKFHSSSDKMLQENIIEESENSNDIKQAIYGKLSTHFSANYIGKNHLCYIQPIKTLPLYLITFYDQSYLHSVILNTTSLTFIFSLLILIMFFLIIFGSRVAIHKRTELKRNLDLLDWLKPNKRKIDKSRNIYIANILAIALIILACLISNSENVILIIFLFIITQLVTTYCYMNFISWDHFRKNYLIGSLFPSVIIIALLLYFVFKALPRPYIYHIFIFNSLLIVTNSIVLRMSPNLFSGFKDHTHFYLYFYSWLSLIVITPVIVFFIIFYNHETKSDNVHNLYAYASKKEARNYNIDKFYHDNVDSLFQGYKKSLKDKGVYYLNNSCNNSNAIEFNAVRKYNLGGGLGPILFHVKTDLDRQKMERKSLVKELSDSNNKSIKFINDSVMIKYTSEQIHYSDTGATYAAYYKGKYDKFGFGKTEMWISFLVTILFFCYIFFKLLKFVSDKVPSSSIGLFFVRERFCDVLNEHINSKNNLMIQFSSIYEKIAYNKKIEEEKLFSTIYHEIINYDKIKEYSSISFKKSQERILVQNVHINFEKPQADCEKLSVINQIAEDDNIQLILLLDCSFAKIIDDNEQLIQFEEDKKHLKQLKNLKKILESTNNKFVHLFPPLTERRSIAKDEKIFEEKSVLAQVNAVIKDELDVSDYLKGKYEQSIKNCVNKIIDAKVSNPHEKIILKIQEYVMGYYESIWEACSNNEKIVLYDISDDLLLNDKNKKVIKILIYKGLLKHNGYIDIMNRSFRNFIIAKFESEYEEEYVKKYESTGMWANYRAPILLIVLAFAFFIALQENILSNFNSILPAIITALGLITKVSGIFSKSSTLIPAASQSGE